MGAGPRMFNKMVVGFGRGADESVVEREGRGGMKERKVAVLCSPSQELSYFCIRHVAFSLHGPDAGECSTREWVDRKASAELSDSVVACLPGGGDRQTSQIPHTPIPLFQPTPFQERQASPNSWASPWPQLL